MEHARSNDQKEIPLWLLLQVITKQIRNAGDLIYRISVKRTHWHHYNVSVRTKSLPRELVPARTLPGEPEILLDRSNRMVSGWQEGGWSR